MMQTNLQAFMFENEKQTSIIDVLTSGGLILYPTDTIWGIGCDACNESSIDKIFQLKKRDPSKSFILLVDSIEMLKDYVVEVHPRIETLLSHHVQPLTVIYEQAKNLPKNAQATDGSVAIRVVQDSFCRNLIAQFGKPLIATSANVSNEPFPTHFGNISSTILTGVDHVVNMHHQSNSKEKVQPSVIVKMAPNGELDFLRT